MATPTPGPWEVVRGNEHHGFYVEGLHGSTICDLYTMSNPSISSAPIPFNPSEDEANACLIAAAPEMLAELIIAEETVRALGLDSMAANLRAAIAKATGK